MGSRRNILLSSLVVVAAWLWPVCGEAQVSGQSSVQGAGLRLSSGLTLHGFANADLRYDTNPSLQPEALRPQGDLSVRGRGGFKLELDSTLFPVTLTGQADYTRYLGINLPLLASLSAFQAAASLQVGINPEGWISGSINDQFARSETGSQIVIGDTVRLIRNTARAGVKVKPGGGALEFNVGYGFDFVLFDQNQRSLPDARALSNYSHLLSANALWRFFPRTAVALEVDQSFTRYFFTSTLIPNVPVNPFRIRAGINGQVTDRIAIRATAGYGNSFVFGPGNFSSVVINSGITWTPIDPLSLGLSYTRDVLPVSLYAFYGTDRILFEYKQQLPLRLTTSARVEYTLESFGRPLVAGLSSRTDHLLRGEARVSWQVLTFLACGIYYGPEMRFTNYRAPGTNISGQYTRHLMGLDATVGY